MNCFVLIVALNVFRVSDNVQPLQCLLLGSLVDEQQLNIVVVVVVPSVI